MKGTRIIMMLTHLLVGIGASFGGYACIADPLCPVGAPISLLEGSVFTSYFLPGLFLFGILGHGNLLCAIFVWKYQILGLLSSMLLGFFLATWIVIQCIIIKDVVALHSIFFGVGLFQFSLSLFQLIKSGHAAYLISELRP